MFKSSTTAWIGAFLGLVFTRSIWGAITGFFVGSLFDKTKSEEGERRGTFAGRSVHHDYDYYRGRVTSNDFGICLLMLSASVMRADGKVMKSELDFVKQFFTRNFGSRQSSEYIRLLRDILNHDFPLEDVCYDIRRTMADVQRHLLIQYLFGIGQADGHVSQAEIGVIETIARNLGLTKAEFESILSMFHKNLSNSYKVLEIDETATDDEVKKAYRKMAVKHHPDKYANMDQSHQETAKQKFQKVQEAYEDIKKERGLI